RCAIPRFRRWPGGLAEAEGPRSTGVLAWRLRARAVRPRPEATTPAMQPPPRWIPIAAPARDRVVPRRPAARSSGGASKSFSCEDLSTGCVLSNPVGSSHTAPRRALHQQTDEEETDADAGQPPCQNHHHDPESSPRPSIRHCTPPLPVNRKDSVAPTKSSCEECAGTG